MFRKLGFYKYGLLIGLMMPIAGLAQDLGSSSLLFSNPKTKSSSKVSVKTTAKKIAAKPRKAVETSKKAAPKSAVKTARNNNAARTNNPPKTNNKIVQKPAQVTVNQPSQPTRTINKNQNTPPPIVENQVDNADEIFEQAIDEGNAARDARQYTKAEGAYLRAQSIKVKDSRAIYGLGNLYSDQQRWEEAERAYRTAISIEPTAAEPHIALSFVLTQPIIGENLAARYTEAEKLARRAIELDPNNAFAHDQLGVALELSGVISQETQNAYRKAIQLEPSFALAYAHLGRLLRKTGSVNESTVAYRKAIENSNDVPTMILVADVMQSQQKYLESEQLLRRALEEDERNPTALFLLGRALTTRGSYEEAEKILKKSAEVSPNSFVSYALLGSMFLRREKFDDAEKYLMKAVAVVSPNEKKRLAQEFEAVGDGYLKNGKNKDAVRVFQKALTLDTGRIPLSEKLARAREN